MKVFFILLFTLLQLGLLAQDGFEGTIVYETSITGQGSSVFNGMLPRQYKLQFLNKDVRVEISGGMLGAMFWPIVSCYDSGRAYMIDTNKKIVYRFIPYLYSKLKYEPAQATDMESDQKILGYKCHHYRIFSSTNTGNSITDVWTTADLDMDIPLNNPFSKTLAYPGLDGLPLLIESTVEHQSAKFKLVIRASEVKHEKLDPVLFEVPRKYKKMPFEALEYGAFE
jgi:hypothetical protein